MGFGGCRDRTSPRPLNPDRPRPDDDLSHARFAARLTAAVGVEALAPQRDRSRWKCSGIRSTRDRDRQPGDPGCDSCGTSGNHVPAPIPGAFLDDGTGGQGDLERRVRRRDPCDRRTAGIARLHVVLEHVRAPGWIGRDPRAPTRVSARRRHHGLVRELATPARGDRDLEHASGAAGRAHLELDRLPRGTGSRCRMLEVGARTRIEPGNQLLLEILEERADLRRPAGVA